MEVLIKNIELNGTLLLTPKAIFRPVKCQENEKIIEKWEIVKDAEIVELPPHEDWQTITPTENGRYLVWCDYGIGADTDDFKDGRWVFYGSHVIAWMPITPFRGENK